MKWTHRSLRKLCKALRRRPHKVLDHDYPSWGKGRANPAGIYDLAHNDGYVVIGVSHETPTFEVEAIRRWWLDVGRKRYGNTCLLLIEADSGGANDHRKWEWKLALQELADEFGLTITVTHFPPGASKWNPIDRKSIRLNSSHVEISYAVFCLKKKIRESTTWLFNK